MALEWQHGGDGDGRGRGIINRRKATSAKAFLHFGPRPILPLPVRPGRNDGDDIPGKAVHTTTHGFHVRGTFGVQP